VKISTRTIVTIVAVAIAAAVLYPFFAQRSSQPAGPGGMAGQPAPVFPMLDAQNGPASLDTYRGKIVVMNLWASWCPPCREEMPDLQRLQTAYANRGVVVVGVNEGESAQRAQSFAQSLGIRFPIWVDERQQYGRVYAALGLPTTVVIDRRGNVARGFDGPLSFDQMRDAVDSTLQ
jgi:thiol-disulfide isomerase/thioredoxin